MLQIYNTTSTYPIAFLVFSSFGLHKFYTAIYQIEFVPKKKMIQITTRIFIDDLNEALEKKYKQKVFIATKNTGGFYQVKRKE
jgi:hypothetical protein